MENENITLEEHRSRTVGEILNLWNTHDRVACVRYTGYGKTYYVLRKVLEILNNGTFLILIPNANLLNRYKETFSDLNNVKFNTYQYIALQPRKNLIEMYKDINYIVCDECHHLSLNKWGESLNKFVENRQIKLLGLTATPIRKDGINVVEQYFNGVETSELDLLEGIKRGYTQKIKYVKAICKIDSNYSSRLNDADRYKIEKLINVPNIFKKHIPEEYLKDNFKVLLFVSRCSDISSAKEQCASWFKEVYPDKNINTYHMSYEETPKFNKEQRCVFEENTNKEDIDILVTVNTLNEGDHIPKVHTVIMLRKTSSFIVFNQQIGRAMNGKEPIILDLVNNSKKLYTEKKRYVKEINANGSSSRIKVMFDDYCTLVDETEDIRDILYKYYKKPERTSLDIELAVINEHDLQIEQIARKYNIAWQTVCNIFRRYGIVRNEQTSDEDLIAIVGKYRDYIELYNGKIPREDIAKHIGINVHKLERGMRLVGIQPKRMYERLNISKCLIEDIIELKELGKTDDEVSTILNVPRNIIIMAKRRANYKSKNTCRYNQLNDDKVKYVLNNHENKTLAEMSKEVGVSHDTIHRILEDNGIEYKPKKTALPITLEEELEICKTYEKVGSLYKTHKKTGRHKSTIRKIVVKHGYKIQEGTR